MKDLNQDQFLISKFMAIIALHTGYNVADRDRKKLVNAVQERMSKLHIEEPLSYYQLLLNRNLSARNELIELTCYFANKETFFFRDAEQFVVLRDNILSQFIIKEYKTKELRILCAGCSSGEEPYSIAMLLVSLIPDWKSWKFVILGIDLCQNMIDRAKAGIYENHSFRSIDANYKTKFFTQQSDGKWLISPLFHQLVSFKQGNLLDTDLLLGEAQFDLIICRNVFIYLHNDAKQKILQNFYKNLKINGYLMTGHGELQLLQPFSVPLKTVSFNGSIVYQKLDTEKNVRS